MPKFCDNIACAFHIDLPDDSSTGATAVGVNGKRAHSRRWGIVRAEDNKRFFFCTTCVNVAHMINSIR